MLAVFALVFVVLPIVEITVAIQVAHHIGAAGAAWEAWLPLKDMGPDLADCTALGCLLAQLEPQTASVIDFRSAPRLWHVCH